jgi:hypothetical protein
VTAGTTAPSRYRRSVGVALRVGVGLAVPSALYYLLRALGQGVYLSLVVSTVLSSVPALYSLVRHRRVDGLSTYFTAMMLGGLVVSLVPGSTRFLLARESLMTAVTGLWFLGSTRARRPLAYQFTKPLVEGRLRWPDHWDRLWDASSLFRRMWRVTSAIWGVGLLADAAARVLLAYTVRPDLVPALGLVLYVATVVVLNVVVTAYQVLCRVHDPRSPLRQGDSPAHGRGPAGTS